MRQYKIFDAFDVLANAFLFLTEEWGFVLKEEENLNYMSLLRYRKNQLTILVAYEYMYNMFEFEFNLDGERILFISFFQKHESNLDWKLYQPDDFQYKESLMRNVECLKKYKEDILKLAEYGII
ncbi:MAG: hypothetical protein LBT27_08095 [Prevotellaceae bacterium]|jgi:hypothetical protein|nr:hypothetical protein [Prevotellaceae bacterium]